MKVNNVWYAGKNNELEIGQKVFIGHCGAGHTVFGEYGTLEKTTKQHLVFKTESGATIKTAIDNLYAVVGKAKKQNIFVSLFTERDFIKIATHLY